MEADAVARVGVVDDHQSTVWGIERILDGHSWLTLAGAAQTVPELLSGDGGFDLAILDLRLTDDSSPQANVELLHTNGIHVLVYTSGEYPDLLRSAAKAGVLGMIPKSAPEDMVIRAIEEAARGEPVLGTEWAAAIDADPDLNAVRLSPQLQRVLTLYANGATSRSISEAMNVQIDTVNEYLKRIRQKYASAGRPANTKLDLFKRALEDGWVSMPHRTSGM